MDDGASLAVRLHLGSGSVYLGPGWTNIDIPGPHTFLAKDRPDLVLRYVTKDEDYYGRHRDKTIETMRQPREQEYVCDAYGSFDNIPAEYWSVDEILARHVFEHLSITEAHKALDQVDGVMKSGGILRLDVPENEETLELYRQTGDQFYKRALFCPRRDARGYSLIAYSRELLRSIVEEHGFVYEAEEPNIHVYPAFCLRFRKPGVRAPRDYIQLPDIPKNWFVADIGPGQYPHPRADIYIDVNDRNLEPLRKAGKMTRNFSISDGLRQIEDKQFDYIWCSHVFEHIEDPIAAAATFSRIGKRGTIVTPGPLKED